MLSPAHILDRGRLVVGLLLVIPAGVLLMPSSERPTTASTGNPAPAEWAVVDEPNPIQAEVVTPDVVLKNLTSRPASSTPSAGTAEKSSGSTAVEEEAKAGAASLAQSPATATRDAGPMPLANPSVADYSVPAKATHVFPVAGGATFSNDWGAVRPGGRVHEGIDLVAASGAPVVAVAAGRITKIVWSGSFGWTFWLRDRWGNEFYFANLSAFAPVAKEGVEVTAGTVIGFVGDSGDAKGSPSHLHFEVHPDGGPATSPFSLISAWPRV